MSDDSKELSRVEDILSGEDYLPKKPMSRVEELLMDGAMVPKVDDTDNGKVLKVIDGEWQPGEDVSGDNLPPVSSLDNGKVLKVVSGEWNIGDDKSESSFVYISSSYPFSGSKVALPANINNVLIANYTSSPKVPTFLVTSNNIIFEPKEVDISVGTTPSVHIRWGRMYSTFDSATREQDIYNDSLSYNTQNQTTEASYFKTKAIQTIPPVDTPDNGKVMQVAGGHWVANILPEVDGVPQVTSSDIGKVLKATDVGEYDWGDASRTNAVQVPPVIFDDGNLKKMEISGFPGIEKVYLTPTAYSNLTTAQKEDLSKIYYVSDYEFKSYNDGTLVLRTDSSNNLLLYFVGVVCTNSNPLTMPSELAAYINNYPDSYGYYDPTDTTSVDCYINCNWSGDNTKYWAQSGRHNGTVINDTPVYGVMNPSGVYGQELVYSDPFDIPNGFIIYYGNKQYTVFDIPDPLPAVSSVDAGKALIVNSDGEWDKGDIPSSVTPVEIEAEDYHILTTVEKEDPTKIYFVKAGRVITDPVSVIPRNPSSSNIDCNTGSASYNTSAVYAFDGVMNTPPDARATFAYSVTAWYPGYGNAPASAWVSYQFDTVTTDLVKLEAYAYNMSSFDPSVTYTTPIIVEGSTDGTNWFNILADGASSFILRTKETEFVKNEIPLDNTVSVSYIRFRFLNQINGYNDPNFAIAEIYAYTGNVVKYDDSTYYKGIKHGKTIQELPELLAADEGKVLKAVNGKWSKDDIYRELTQAEYDALPSSKNSDGIIYFITDNS